MGQTLGQRDELPDYRDAHVGAECDVYGDRYRDSWGIGGFGGQMIKKIVNFYNTSTVFHSFVSGVEGAIVGALSSWSGGVPVGKAGWIALAAFIGKALWSWWKRWAQNNVATVSVATQGMEVSSGKLKEVKP
jgi:hypothetical protein